jgi:hypothetical protein
MKNNTKIKEKNINNNCDTNNYTSIFYCILYKLSIGVSSSTMYYKGNIINNPCNPLGERTVATALYVEP